MTKEVTFELVKGPITDRIDDACRAKYGGSPYLHPMIGARARAATVKVMPRETNTRSSSTRREYTGDNAGLMPQPFRVNVCELPDPLPQPVAGPVPSPPRANRGLGVRAPNQTAVAERFVQTVKSEALDHFIVCGEQHLRHILSEFLAHFHEERPHQGVGNVPLGGVPPSAEEPAILPLAEVRCRERPGGLLKHYQRAS